MKLRESMSSIRITHIAGFILLTRWHLSAQKKMPGKLDYDALP